MRAERFHGWCIRSPNWRNELFEKDIRQESPASPGFFLCAVVALGKLSLLKFLRNRIYTVVCAKANLNGHGKLRQYRCRVWRGHAFEIAIATALHLFDASAGLPCSDEQKKTRLRSHLSA
jgi:hypothetical protein